MINEALTGARKPEQTDGPLGGVQISNAVDDLARYTRPEFTSNAARDAAFAAWDALPGNTMHRGLRCTVAGVPQIYTGSGWSVQHTNGGHVGAALAGTAAPAGAELIVKTWVGQIITNASGDYTMFPPSPFANGLHSIHITCATGSAQPFFFNTWGHALTSVNVRAYNITAGSAAASLSITADATWVGW